MKSLKEFQEKYQSIMTDFQKEGKELIEKEIKEVFEKNPELHAIGWIQNTPSFNDGDPCVFGVSDIHILTKEDQEGEDYGDFDDSVYDWRFNGYRDQQYDLGNIFDNEEFLKIAFGDGFQIKATREGFHLEEYYDY